MKLLCIHYLACLVVLIGAVACGSPEPVKTPPPTQPGSGSSDALVQGECGRCHASQSPRFTTAAELARLGSTAKHEIDEGHMPPDRRLQAETKKRLSDIAGGAK